MLQFRHSMKECQAGGLLGEACKFTAGCVLEEAWELEQRGVRISGDFEGFLEFAKRQTGCLKQDDIVQKVSRKLTEEANITSSEEP